MDTTLIQAVHLTHMIFHINKTKAQNDKYKHSKAGVGWRPSPYSSLEPGRRAEGLAKEDDRGLGRKGAAITRLTREETGNPIFMNPETVSSS